LKYANQISIVLAAIGVGIAAYAFSLTLFSPPPTASLNVDALRKRALERLGTEPITTLSSANTTAAAATSTIAAPSSTRCVRPRPNRAANNPRKSTTSSDLVAQPNVEPNQRRVTSPQRDNARTPGMPVWIGDRAARPTRERRSLESATQSGSAMVGAPGFDPGPPGAGGPPEPMVRPPAGAEGNKRDATSDPADPPVRSSMPRL